MQDLPAGMAEFAPCCGIFFLHTSPQGLHGISANDLACAYGIASDSDRALAPFMIPQGLPETEQVATMFSRFRQLYGTLTRFNRENALNAQQRHNATRIDRTFEPGETVFRKLPRPARVAKHLFPSPCSGPYVVHSQPSPASLVLCEPVGGALVDNGRLIPLDQIVAGPRRARLEFEQAANETDVRPMSAMMDGESLQATPPLRTGG